MAGTKVLISLVLHLAFLFFSYWSAQHCASLKASVGVCSKFNYNFLQPDQTDLFDTENTVFTKPVHLVQQQCMVRRRGLKGSKRRQQEINDSRQNTSQVTSLSHKTTRHEEELAAGPCAGPGWHKSEPQRWKPAAPDFGQAFRAARADFIPCEVQWWQTTSVHQSCMWLKKNFCFFFSQRSHRQSTEDNKAATLWTSQF